MMGKVPGSKKWILKFIFSKNIPHVEKISRDCGKDPILQVMEDVSSWGYFIHLYTYNCGKLSLLMQPFFYIHIFHMLIHYS